MNKDLRGDPTKAARSLAWSIMPKMRKTDADAIDQTQFTIDEDLREIK
jgi:hypothetical protein